MTHFNIGCASTLYRSQLFKLAQVFNIGCASTLQAKAFHCRRLNAFNQQETASNWCHWSKRQQRCACIGGVPCRSRMCMALTLQCCMWSWPVPFPSRWPLWNWQICVMGVDVAYLWDIPTPIATSVSKIEGGAMMIAIGCEKPNQFDNQGEKPLGRREEGRR